MVGLLTADILYFSFKVIAHIPWHTGLQGAAPLKNQTGVVYTTI